MKKQIYVRNEDAPIFDRAAELGGNNLSAVIAEALRRYVAAEEAKRQGFEEQEIRVGIWRERGADDVKTLKFIGKLLATGTTYTGQATSGDDRGVDYEIYATQKGKILVRRLAWSRWQGENDRATYKVFDTLEDVRKDEYAPGSLIEEAAEKMGVEVVEYLDI